MSEKMIYKMDGVQYPFKASSPPTEEDMDISKHIADELSDMVDSFKKQLDEWGKKYACKAHAVVEVDHIEILD